MKAKGQYNGRAKLTDKDVRLMRYYRHGDENGDGAWTLEELEAFFGVTSHSVSVICRGLAYKDAGGPITENKRVINVRRPVNYTGAETSRRYRERKKLERETQSAQA